MARSFFASSDSRPRFFNSKIEAEEPLWVSMASTLEIVESVHTAKNRIKTTTKMTAKPVKPIKLKNGIILTPLEDGRTQVSGRTFDLKDAIKTAKGVWDPATKTWTLPAGVSTDFLVPPPPPKPKAREDWTKEEWDRYVQTYYSGRRRGNIERCCNNAKAFTQYDYQGPTCYDCPTHGKTYNSFCGD